MGPHDFVKVLQHIGFDTGGVEASVSGEGVLQQLDLGAVMSSFDS